MRNKVSFPLTRIIKKLSLKKEQLWEDKKYTIWGMPFYNKAEETTFDKEFNKELL